MTDSRRFSLAAESSVVNLKPSVTYPPLRGPPAAVRRAHLAAKFDWGQPSTENRRSRKEDLRELVFVGTSVLYIKGARRQENR